MKPESAQGADWRELSLIVLISFPFLFWGAVNVDFLDPNEGLYGSIAREMAESGDWVTPRFNGVRYLEKPPLHFWMTALTMRLFGPSEWAVRLWSVLPAFGAALLLWRLGVILYGGRAGLLSAVVFLTGVGVFRYMHVAAPDFLLVFSVTLSIYGFVKAVLAKGEGHSVFPFPFPLSRFTFHVSPFTFPVSLFWLGLALGVMSKGLIGIVLPASIVASWAVVNSARRNFGLRIANCEIASPGKVAKRKFEIRIVSSFLAFLALLARGKRIRLPQRHEGREGKFQISDELPTWPSLRLFARPLGVLLFVALTLPWHALAAIKNPGFLHFYLLDNQLLRFLDRRAFIEDDVPVGAVAFLILTLVWFFPWSFFIPVSLRYGFPRMGRTASPDERLRLLVGLWGLVILGFFSLSSSTLEHYFLPAMPALSLMVGALWAGFMVRGQSGGLPSSAVEPTARSRRSATVLNWTLGLAALFSLAAGIRLWDASERLTANGFLRGLAHLNVYYRILRDQGLQFPFESIAPFAELVKQLGIGMAIVIPAAWLFFRLCLYRLSFGCAVVMAGLTAVLVSRLVFLIEPHHSTRAVAAAVKERASESDRIVHAGSLEYSGGLPFYTGRQIYLLNGKRGDLEFGSRYAETRHLYLDTGKFAEFWNGGGRVFFITRSPPQNGKIEDLPFERSTLVGRYGSRWLYSNMD